MYNTKLLLLTLLTVFSLGASMAQNQVTIHGTVVNVNGEPEENVNILVSAFFPDSTAFLESLYTGADGTYSTSIVAPDPNFFVSGEVAMVDCSGITLSEEFVVFNGDTDVEINFEYCTNNNMDSCSVIILSEWNPGSNYSLTAWTPIPASAYLWNTGESTETIFPQSSGFYCVTVTLPFGCTVDDCIQVNLDSSGNCFTYIVSTINSDGSYDLEAIASGTAPFLYTWNNGETTQTLDNVGPGTYCVVVVDSTGCSYTACIIVDDFNFCEVYIYEDPFGGLSANSFGTPPFEYLWNTGASTPVIYPNAEGEYCVTVTDANNCSSYSCYYYGWFQDTCYVYVSAFMQDSSTFALQAISYTPAQSWAYLWSTGETTEIIYPQDPSQSYCVTMTDSDGCVSSACFDANNWCYAWVDIQYLDTTTAVLTAYTDPIFGWWGNNTATYLWSNGDTSPVITVTESGEYCVTVTIGNACVSEACIYVDFENLGNDCSAWVYQYQDSSGLWYAEAFAWGWGTFEYLWSNGDTNSVTLISGPNEYVCVTVTSSLGCETVACLDTFFSPCKPEISVTYVSNTSAVLTAYAWNDPNQNATFTWSTGETGPVITVTTEGTYCVTISAAGCVGETCVDVYFWNMEQCGVWISEDSSPGSGILYTANAWGTEPFTYLWSNGGTEQTNFVDFGIHDLCVTITDATGCVSSGCNYPLDSCYVGLFYSNNPTSSIYVETFDPLANVVWSTGDTLDWIEITEPGEYCATVTTVFGCVTTTCITVDSLTPPNGPYDISGYVYADTFGLVSGWVNAYQMDNNSGNAFTLVDSAQIGDDGFYYISGLAEGFYLLKAVIDENPNSLEFLPTYHLSSATWDRADPHVLPNWLTITTDIKLIRTTDMNGGGVIGGTITDPQHILAGEDHEERGLTGIPNIEVLLRDEQGQPLTYTLTLEDGSFRFTGLPLRTYRISFDIPGITSPDVWVTLTAQEPERLEVTLIVTGALAVDEPASEEVRLYPNPAKEEINIPLPGVNADFDVRMTDMQGKIIYVGSATSINGILSIDVGSYTPGMYYVNVKGEEGHFYGRFLKQE